MSANAKKPDVSEPKALFLDYSTYVQEASGGHSYRCAKVMCRRWRLKHVGGNRYQCRDCGQIWEPVK